MQYNFHFEVADNWIAAPQDMVACLFAIALAVAEETGTPLPTAVAALGTNQRPDEQAAVVARRLVNASSAVIIIGQISMAHDQSAALRQLAYYIADAASTGVCTLPAGGNPAGAWAAGAVPHRSAGGNATDNAGLDAMAMLAQPLNTYLLWDFEPGLDTANAGATLAALAGADTAIAVTPFASETMKAHADILLPLAPVMESEGRLTSLQQDKQNISAAAAVSGQARPGWKILRQLGNDLGLDGFEFVALTEIRAELDETLAGGPEIAPVADLSAADKPHGLYRLGDVPIYSADAMCRRSAPLQETVHAVNGCINLNPEDAGKLGLGDGAMAQISQGGCSAELPVRLVAEIPPGVARLPAATNAHSQLGAAFGPITVTAS
jgi:NADH-quinone oxidoreductase subunit G